MANPEHLQIILEQGVQVWNAWRDRGLDHGIGHLALMRPQKRERLNPPQG